MKRTVHDCDRCGAPDVQPVAAKLATTAAKGGVELVELCEPCAAWAFAFVAERLAHSTADNVSASIKARRNESQFPASEPDPDPDPPGAREPWRFDADTVVMGHDFNYDRVSFRRNVSQPGNALKQFTEYLEASVNGRL